MAFKTPNDKKFGTVTADTVKTNNLVVIEIDSFKASGTVDIVGQLQMPALAVAQATSITTAVTGNSTVLSITTQAATAAAGASQTFTVNNNLVTAASKIFVEVNSYAGTFTTNGIPVLNVDNIVAGTSFDIVISNAHSANALNGVLVIKVLIIN